MFGVEANTPSHLYPPIDYREIWPNKGKNA